MKKSYSCMDCGIDHNRKDKQDYMLHDNIWLLIVPKIEGILCISCAEKRLRRKFIDSDFKITPEEMFKRFEDYLNKEKQKMTDMRFSMKIISILIIIISIHGNNAMSQNLNWTSKDIPITLKPAPTKFVFHSGDNIFLEFDLENKTIWLDPDLQPKEIAEKFIESMKYLGYNLKVKK